MKQVSEILMYLREGPGDGDLGLERRQGKLEGQNSRICGRILWMNPEHYEDLIKSLSKNFQHIHNVNLILNFLEIKISFLTTLTYFKFLML